MILPLHSSLGVLGQKYGGLWSGWSGLADCWHLDEESGARYDAVGANHLVNDLNTVGCATSNGLWTLAHGVTLGAGGGLTKTGAVDSWDAGAYSIQGIASGDGYMEFTAGTLVGLHMLGLSHDRNLYDYGVLDYMLYLHSNGYVYAFFNGGGSPRLVTWATGDVFRVGIEAGVVKARKNGALIYTYADAPTYPQFAAASLYTSGVNISAASLSGADLVDVNPTAKRAVAASFIRYNGEYLSRASITDGPAGSFTAAAWVKALGISGSGTWGILNLGTNGANSMNNQAGSLYVSNAVNLVALVGDGSAYQIAIKAGTAVNDGNWHLVVMSYDDSTRVVSASIDAGAPAVSPPLAGAKKSPAGVYVGQGAASYSSGSTWNGLIDEVLLWSRVTTAAELSAVWSAGAGKFYPD